MRRLLNYVRRSPRLYPWLMTWVDRWPWLRNQLRDWVENRAAPRPQPASDWPEWHIQFTAAEQLPQHSLQTFWCGGYAALLGQPPAEVIWPRRQLLVDVSDLVRFDLHTGIQRVVRNVLHHWLLHEASAWQVEPVFEYHGRYYYARRYTCQWLGVECPSELRDHPVSVKSGDVFVGLDWAMPMLERTEPLLQKWRQQGVRLNFVIYDLLPLTLPQYFPAAFASEMQQWLLRMARLGDHLSCISSTVAKEVEATLKAAHVSVPVINHFPLGSDLPVTPQQPPPEITNKLTDQPVLLMVGTIDPRKGYEAVLQSMRQLWHLGVNVQLVIVGRPTSRVESTVAQLQQAHRSPDVPLLWHYDCDDACLEWWYQRAQWLLAASEGEGYGLPLIEAARRGLPVIARDLPVFREVAPPATMFFSDNDQLIDVIQVALQQPASNTETLLSMPTWEHSAHQLLQQSVGQ